MRMCLSLLYFFTSVVLFSKDVCPAKISPKIIGGDEASIVDYPYQASIRKNRRTHVCGGSLISPFYVLSAAHCFVEERTGKQLPAAVWAVGLGHSRIADGQVLYRVSEVLVHEEYTTKGFPIRNDIALLRLSRPARVDNVTIAVIPLEDHPPAPGTTCNVSGWGTTEMVPGAGGVVNQLRAVRVMVYPKDICSDMTWLNSSVICAGVKMGGKDSCQGDSGGPLACGGVLSGVVSWGEGCGRPDSPGVYTEVSYYKNWIADHMSEPRSATAKPTISSILIAFLALLVLRCHDGGSTPGGL